MFVAGNGHSATPLGEAGAGINSTIALAIVSQRAMQKRIRDAIRGRWAVMAERRDAESLGGRSE